MEADMRRFLRLAAVAVLPLLIGASALGSNLPLYTGPAGTNPTADFPIGLGTVNQLVQAINGGVSGLLNAQTAAVATGTGTAEQTLQQYTAPANTLASAGQALRITCWGTTGANGNTKTMKLYFGASVVTTPAAATNALGWSLSMLVMRRTATTQGINAGGLVNVTPVSPMTTDGAETLTAGVLIKCTGTDGTSSASDITANGMTVELVK